MHVYNETEDDLTVVWRYRVSFEVKGKLVEVL